MDSGAAEQESDTDQTLKWMGAAFNRLGWGYSQVAAGEEDPRWEASEVDTSVADVSDETGETGAGLYYFNVTRNLKTATRCYQAAQFLLDPKASVGAIPIEILLRSGLLATAKTLFLLQPKKRKSREARFKQIYRADRSSLAHATSRERGLLGLEVPEDGPRPQVIQESRIIRDVLDDLVAYGDCSCGDEMCPQSNIEAFRHRVMLLWWAYSSVAHVNVWHLEKLSAVAPSGNTQTTGNIGRAFHDLSWLYTESVVRFHERYRLPDSLAPLTPHAATR